MPWKGKMNMNPLLVLLSQTGSTTCVLVPRLWPVEIEAATKATAGAQAIATIAGQAIGAGLTTAADQSIGAGPTTATGLLHAASLAKIAGQAGGAETIFHYNLTKMITRNLSVISVVFQ